jgi:hypothetical protein
MYRELRRTEDWLIIKEPIVDKNAKNKTIIP